MRTLGIKYFLLHFFVYMFFHGIVQAQRFGGNPTTVKWKQIDMQSADIIFPKGMDTAAFAISKWINRIDKEKTGKLGGAVIQNTNSRPESPRHFQCLCGLGSVEK